MGVVVVTEENEDGASLVKLNFDVVSRPSKKKENNPPRTRISQSEQASEAAATRGLRVLTRESEKTECVDCGVV
jgi:hypothetical protein